MHIEITNSAKQWLEVKRQFYLKQNRMPRILLAAQTCHGAEFRLHFDTASEADIIIESEGIRFLIDQTLPAVYGGFRLDVERFFFTTRLLITPENDIKTCDCGKSRPCGE